jgi:hypothetical protein
LLGLLSRQLRGIFVLVLFAHGQNL